MELFFEVFGTQEQGTGMVHVSNLIKVVKDANHIFKETFYQAKTMCDKMNTNLDGRITKQEFLAFCQ